VVSLRLTTGYKLSSRWDEDIAMLVIAIAKKIFRKEKAKSGRRRSTALP